MKKQLSDWLYYLRQGYTPVQAWKLAKITL